MRIAKLWALLWPSSAIQVSSEKRTSPNLWTRPMLHIALWEPEIPPNTGNIARLCAASGTRLHLIGRLGFRLDDRDLKRAGCDYWPAVDVQLHDTLEAFEAIFPNMRIFCLSARA